MTITRYEHQVDIVKRTVADLKNGYTDLFFVATMGAGKTTAGCDLAADLIGTNLDTGLADLYTATSAGHRVLWLAHREELVAQAYNRWCSLYPQYRGLAGIVMAGRNDTPAQVVFGSVQTVVGEARIADLCSFGPFKLVVIDECHHAVAESYQAIVGAIKEHRRRLLGNDPLWHVGMTATANRADQRGLVEVYQKCTARYGLKEMIQLGVLVPFKAYAVETGLSIAKVRTVGTKDPLADDAGDFNHVQLAKVMDADNAHDLIVASYQKYGDGKQAIAFMAGVKHAHALAAKFNAAGITAIAIDGTTKDDVRRAALIDFKAGRICVLCNHNVFTEGLDLPQIEVVLWATPTKSDMRYLQGIGRGLRKCDEIGKTECIILDFVPIEYRDVVQAGDLLGKPKMQKQIERTAESAGTIISAFSYTGEGTGVDGDPDELHTRPLQYLSLNPLNWFYHAGLATLDLGEKDGWSRCLALTRASDKDGEFRLLRAEWRKNGEERVVMQGKSFDYSMLADAGAEYATLHAAEALIQKDRVWQREPVSEMQLHRLRKLMPDGLPGREMASLTKGEASKLIGHLTCREVMVRVWERIEARRAAVLSA